jgi:uncharacterized SAM-binding protein YcdF (DUF218 family)
MGGRTRRDHALMDLFLVKKVLTVLVLPPTGPLILTFLGLILLEARPMLGRGLAWLGMTTLLAFSLPIVSGALLRSLEDSGALDFAQASGAQAIVILGGGIRRDAAEYGGDTLGRLTLDRVRYGALVARKTKLPVLVTGGVVQGGTPEAELMKQSLEEEFHVKVRWAEVKSRNTHENAVDSSAILLASGIRHVILVTHGFDMRRAKAEFTVAGLKVDPAPTYIPSQTFDSPLELLPSVSALQGSYYALYELLANAARRFGV